MSNEIPYFEYAKTETREQLLEILDKIKAACIHGVRPIIHIEAHGNKNDGIFLGDLEEKLSWSELYEAMLEINRESENNTGLVLAACHGLHAIRPLKIQKPTPFYFLIGSEEEVSAGVIDEQMKRFYKYLFEGSSLTGAMNQIDNKFQQFHAECFFCIAMGKYFSQACMGKGRQVRIERLVSESIMAGSPCNSTTLRQLRKSAKNHLKPSKKIFDRYANIFLHGRHSIDFVQFLQFIQAGKRGA